MIEEKIQLIKGNADIIQRKIIEAREATVFEEEKIPSVKEDKKLLERELWEVKS